MAPCTRLKEQFYVSFQAHDKYSSSYRTTALYQLNADTRTLQPYRQLWWANLLLKNKQKYVVVNTDFSIFHHGLQKIQNTASYCLLSLVTDIMRSCRCSLQLPLYRLRPNKYTFRKLTNTWLFTSKPVDEASAQHNVTYNQKSNGIYHSTLITLLGLVSPDMTGYSQPSPRGGSQHDGRAPGRTSAEFFTY